jgi:hypothetical protein
MPPTPNELFETALRQRDADMAAALVENPDLNVDAGSMNSRLWHRALSVLDLDKRLAPGWTGVRKTLLARTATLLEAMPCGKVRADELWGLRDIDIAAEAVLRAVATGRYRPNLTGLGSAHVVRVHTAARRRMAAGTTPLDRQAASHVEDTPSFWAAELTSLAADTLTGPRRAHRRTAIGPVPHKSSVDPSIPR